MLALKVLGHHVVSVGGSAVFVVLVVVIGAAIEIRRSLVLVGSTVLLDTKSVSDGFGNARRGQTRHDILNLHMCSE